MSRQISEERKTAYYLGMVLEVLGLLLFFSVFITVAMSVANSGDLGAHLRSIAFREIGRAHV